MSSEINSAIGLGVIALLTFWIGRRKDFFRFSSEQDRWEVPVHLKHLFGAFAIYFLISMLASFVFGQLLRTQMTTNLLGYASWFNFTTSLAIFLSLGIYWRFLHEKLRMGLLRRPSEKRFTVAQNLGFALLAWVIAFPLVLFASQILEILVYMIFNVTQLPDQIAVHFVKMTFQNPTYFALAVGSIVFLAPLIEETLFRGFLQSFIRQHLGPKQAILITSLCFSFFHYSAEQGLGNIPIIGSLFILALFLGFLYERQGSLAAPIFLHGTFNAISILNLYFLGDFASGL